MKNLLPLALLWLSALATPTLAQTTPEVRTVAAFQQLEVSSGVELDLIASPTQRVEASADTPELLARIKTEVHDGVLKVSFEHRLGDIWGKTLNTHHLRVSVAAPALSAVRASSGALLTIAGPYASPNLQVEASSGAILRADLQAQTVRAQVSSGGIATLTGTMQRLEVEASSGGIFRGPSLQAATCDADASSGGTITVAVQESLTAKASSGGDVNYSGSPQVTKHTSSGGSVSRR